MSAPGFEQCLSQVASRLRHDLKGGLITLKMGLESLDDEEALKPLLLEKTEELVDLSDKLVLLLRMGELRKASINPRALLQQVRGHIEDRFPTLQVSLDLDEDLANWDLDPDALTYAFLELAQNATLAGANTLFISSRQEDGWGLVRVGNDGSAVAEDVEPEYLLQLGHSLWQRSGLGFSVVDGCVRGHGGKFVLELDDQRRLCSSMQFGLEATA